ncbi:unnamed protein product [Cuscuta europaea]|uniref:Uncharacterized protein n=1 Tax=Cuscuta europaea TaxID=41803 RepID=A0A9P0ZZ02_CUSEU|nr:unnamed protein product [Cuscuta europaea]
MRRMFRPSLLGPSSSISQGLTMFNRHLPPTFQILRRQVFLLTGHRRNQSQLCVRGLQMEWRDHPSPLTVKGGFDLRFEGMVAGKKIGQHGEECSGRRRNKFREGKTAPGRQTYLREGEATTNKHRFFREDKATSARPPNFRKEKSISRVKNKLLASYISDHSRNGDLLRNSQ